MIRTNLDVDYRLGNLKQYCNCIAIEDSPCLLYINSDGWDDHVVPVNPDDEYLQEVFEAAYIDDRGSTNFYYPFGRKQAVNLSIGDSWHANEDSVRMYFSTDSPESWATQRTTFTLKDIKMKKGEEIAIVDITGETKIEMNLLLYIFGERILLTGNTTGTFDLKIQAFQSGVLHKSSEYGDLFGDMEMDGEKF